MSRFGLRGLLEDAGGFEIAGEAKDGCEAVSMFGRLRPDVAIMDMRLPELDGVQATHAIRTIDSNARVLVLSSYDTQADVVRARDAGILQLIALGCTSKDVGETMSLSEGTVRVYVSRILAKLGVGNRAEAVS